MELIPGYALRLGSAIDRSLLVKFMQRTYGELFPNQSHAHLAQTVDQYLSKETPLWWVDAVQNEKSIQASLSEPEARHQPIACLWLGHVVDQAHGDRHSHIFLLYVAPDHRRQGIAAALMHHAETWAKERGDRQISLHVFQTNIPAVTLYEKLGYQSQSQWMTKQL